MRNSSSDHRRKKRESERGRKERGETELEKVRGVLGPSRQKEEFVLKGREEEVASEEILARRRDSKVESSDTRPRPCLSEDGTRRREPRRSLECSTSWACLWASCSSSKNEREERREEGRSRRSS